MVNAWVSINNPNVLTPNLGNGLGIDITLRNAQNTIRGTFNFKPTGRVIEGWQQVKECIRMSRLGASAWKQSSIHQLPVQRGSVTI